MAATVSSVWAKPGAWALDSEEHEDELKLEKEIDHHNHHHHHHTEPPPAAEFPSLSAAATTKPKKKNKPHTLSLAEFSTYGSTPKPASYEPKRLTQEELVLLPTGPRERTAEELDRTRLGGGFRNYGGGGGGGMGSDSRVRVSDRNRDSNRERDLGPSRADEVDDWSKTKRFGSFGGGSGPGSGSGSERREKVGFFNSSRADEVDNWASNKSFAPSDGPRRERRAGFESYSNGPGSDSENWLRKKEDRALDSEKWGRKEEGREYSNGNGSGNGVGRPRLNLQPRSLPVNNGQGGHTPTEGKPKGSNPFGEARPREEVLAEKGKDWKEIDEKLEAVKMKELGGGGGGERRGFGMGRLESGDDKTVKSWRKPESNDTAQTPLSDEITENADIDSAENIPEEN